MVSLNLAHPVDPCNVCRLVAGDRSWHNKYQRSVKITIALESPIGDFNLLRYIHRSVILITSFTNPLRPVYHAAIFICNPHFTHMSAFSVRIFILILPLLTSAIRISAHPHFTTSKIQRNGRNRVWLFTAPDRTGQHRTAPGPYRAGNDWLFHGYG